MNGAEFKAKKRIMGISSHKTGRLCGGVSRVTVESWEKGEWALPPDAEAVMDDLWDNWLDRLGAAMETADETVGDSGADEFEIAIFRTQQLYQQAAPSSDLEWAEHTAFQEALILTLTLSDIPVVVEHAEDVLAR